MSHIPSKFYLRATQDNPNVSAGEKSVVQPVAASQFGLTPTTRDLWPFAGTSGTTKTQATNATTSAQNGCIDRWSTPLIAGGTYGAGTWTLAVQSTESDTNANTFFVSPCVYFYRPSTSAVVGFVSDTDTSTGVEFGNDTTSRYGQVLTWAGSPVVTNDGDVLVIEIWVKMTQAVASSYNITVRYDGATDVTAAYSGTDPASYLLAPVDLPLFIPNQSIVVTQLATNRSSFR